MGGELVAEAVDDLDVAGVAGFEPEGVNRRIAEASLGFEALAVGVGEQEERVKRGPNIVVLGRLAVEEGVWAWLSWYCSPGGRDDIGRLRLRFGLRLEQGSSGVVVQVALQARIPGGLWCRLRYRGILDYDSGEFEERM